MKTTQVSSRRAATIVFTALAVVALCPVGKGDAVAQSAHQHDRVARSATQAFAQAQPKSRRARVRPRIRVTPAYPYRLQSLPYPPPYDYEYPGPNAVRQCTAHLVQEARPSGTVIVPRTTCWWERG